MYTPRLHGYGIKTAYLSNLREEVDYQLYTLGANFSYLKTQVR